MQEFQLHSTYMSPLLPQCINNITMNTAIVIQYSTVIIYRSGVLLLMMRLMYHSLIVPKLLGNRLDYNYRLGLLNRMVLFLVLRLLLCLGVHT